MITQVLIAAASALVALAPGYFLGQAIQGRRRTYLVVFWGVIVLMVPLVAWGLWSGNTEVAAVSLGFAFGMINGLRHGFAPVFAPLVAAAKQSEDARS